MKIVSTNTRRTYHIDPPAGNEIRMLCPECSHTRKKQKDKCFAWNNDSQLGFCHNCLSTFFLHKPHSDEKQYFVPQWKNITKLTDKAVRWFEGRMIKQDVLVQMKIHSDAQFMSQLGKEIETIAFPYFRSGKFINCKFRGPQKSFKMIKDAELIFWNLDAVQDSKEVIITEGEMDALCFIQAGYPHTISVPNGANTGSMEYLDSSIGILQEKKRIYLSTDNDQRGVELRDELIRRLGPERCYLVNLKDCKDANDYLLKYGPDFMGLISEARPAPVKGVISISEMYSDIRSYFEKGIQPGVEIGIPEIDKHITWETGRLAICTGIPGHGKSSIVDFIVARLMMKYGWKAGFYTPENYPLKFHSAKIFELLTCHRFSQDDTPESVFDQAVEFMDDHVSYVLNEEDMTLDNILEGAKYLVRTKGIKILVVDPYSRIEHRYERGQSETQYIGLLLDKLLSFAQVNNCLTFLVAHPRKMEGSGGTHKCPTLYDISGSAHFFNKTDYGFTVYRQRNPETGILTKEAQIHFQKVKYKHLGETGVAQLHYHYNSGRYHRLGDSADKSNWIDTGPDQKEFDWQEIREESLAEVPF